ncbi:MAG TPA: hypothetical protein VGM90_35355 [Kofleriaceae bacterium]
MTEDEKQLLIEQVAGAWRPDAGDELTYHKAWHDLDDDARLVAADRARALRKIESALDGEGLSTTARNVLAKITRASRRP